MAKKSASLQDAFDEKASVGPKEKAAAPATEKGVAKRRISGGEAKSQTPPRLMGSVHKHTSWMNDRIDR